MSQFESTAPVSSLPNPSTLGRAFRWIWCGQAISLTGTQLSAVSFQLIAVSVLHASAAQMGVLTAAQTFPYLFLGLALGVVIDSYPRRVLLIGSDIARFATLLGASILILEHRLTIHGMWAVVCLTATFNLVFDASLGAFIPELLLPSQWLGANSRLSATVSAGEVLGPGLAGYIVQALSAPFTILLDALSYMFSAVCILFCKPVKSRALKTAIRSRELAGDSGQRVSRLAGIREGLNFVVKHPILRILALWSAVWNFSWSAVLAVLVLYLSRTLHMTAAMIGICFAVGGTGGVVGASAAGWLAARFSRGRVLVYAPLAGALGGAILLGSGSGYAAAFVVASLFFFNLGQSAFGVNMQTSRQEVTPAFMMGRMDTTMRLCFTGMSSLGALVGGLIGSRMGLHSSLTFGVAGLLLTAAGLRASSLAELVDAKVPSEAPGPLSMAENSTAVLVAPELIAQ